MQCIFVRKKGTISHARQWAGAHVKESKISAQGLHSTCAGMLAMHREIGSVPRPDRTHPWFAVDALLHQNICKTRRKRIHTKCVVRSPGHSNQRPGAAPAIAMSRGRRKTALQRGPVHIISGGGFSADPARSCPAAPPVPSIVMSGDGSLE